MSFDKKQLPLVLGLLAVIAAVCVYFFVYRGYQEKIAGLQAANGKLQQQVDDLKTKVNSQQQFVDAMAEMDAGIQKVYALFPPALQEEDAVMEALRLEALAPMRVSALDFQDPITLYTVGSGGEGAPAPAPVEGENGETTLEQDVAAAQAGETTEYGEYQVPDIQFSQGVLAPGYEGEFGPISLNVNTVNMNFTTSYQGLKRMLDYISHNPNRRTVNNIAIAADGALLSVGAIVSEYSLTGTGKVYDYPALPSVLTGTDDIFGVASMESGDFLEMLLLNGGKKAEGEEGEAETQDNSEDDKKKDDSEAKVVQPGKKTAQ
ncbi:MAG: hypothetical protein J5829_06080 [Lachnospiraceae bacterium]|nr:hypothetical protein [Lachnospiraceae bacterium]